MAEGFSHSRWSYFLRLPLRDLELWSKRGIAEHLTDLLYWFTEDRWTFAFVPRRVPPRPAETESYLSALPVNPPPAAVLFSGGLNRVEGDTHAESRSCYDRP